MNDLDKTLSDNLHTSLGVQPEHNQGANPSHAVLVSECTKLREQVRVLRDLAGFIKRYHDMLETKGRGGFPDQLIHAMNNALEATKP